jgi:membrane associated rhomboid family serine protease
MSQFGRFGGGLQMTEVVKNIIIVNAAVFLVTYMLPQFIPSFSFGLLNKFAIYYPSNPDFKPYQIITYMFTHGGYLHIFFNMFALYNFGTLLERVWGPKRFAFFYLFCGIAALVMYFGVNAAVAFYQSGTVVLTPGNSTSKMLFDIYAVPCVGASGAIYGLLAAFAMLFPNTQLIMLFFPVPIKAKYAVPLIIILFDFTVGVASFGQSGIGHFAHIGGAVSGFLLVWYWNKSNKKTLW